MGRRRIGRTRIALQISDRRSCRYGGIMATETFIVRVLEANRITIPQEYVEVLKLKKGDKVRVSVEKVGVK